MNKNRHRIIFNAARGQRMVVAESASSEGAGSAGGASGEISAPGSAAESLGDIDICKPSLLRELALHPLTLSIALALTLGLVFYTSAHAQIVADPSAPGNQRPTILQTGNGLPQINIQTPSAAGVSRNTYSRFDVDSRGAILNNSRTNVQAQTGGMIAGNAWLATGEARVILNEVRSSNPSYLNGYVEVAGRRAEVIVANPAGISVNGGGFINASGVTLTTGVPVMNNGHLESFRVGGGKVRIEGLGLDTSTADYTAILARAMEVNAGLWAKNLTVVTGTNEVKALATGAAAQVIAAGDIDNTAGTFASQQSTRITSGALNNHQGLIQSLDTLNITATGLVNTQGTVASGGTMAVAARHIDNTEGAITGHQDAAITSDRLDNRKGLIQAVQNLNIHTAGALGNIEGKLVAGGNAQLTAADIDNTQGTVASDQGVTIDSASLNNHLGKVQALKTLDIHTQGHPLTNTQGLLAAGESVFIDAGRIDNTGDTVAAQQNATLTSTQLTNDQGLIQAVGTLDIQANGALDNVKGTLLAGGHAQIHATTVNNTQGTLASNQNLVLISAGLNNTQGKVQALPRPA